MSNNKAETLAKIINDKGRDFGINSDEDLWHFLAQAGHEVGAAGERRFWLFRYFLRTVAMS